MFIYDMRLISFFSSTRLFYSLILFSKPCYILNFKDLLCEKRKEFDGEILAVVSCVLAWVNVFQNRSRDQLFSNLQKTKLENNCYT